MSKSVLYLVQSFYLLYKMNSSSFLLPTMSFFIRLCAGIVSTGNKTVTPSWKFNLAPYSLNGLTGQRGATPFSYYSLRVCLDRIYYSWFYSFLLYILSFIYSSKHIRRACIGLYMFNFYIEPGTDFVRDNWRFNNKAAIRKSFGIEEIGCLNYNNKYSTLRIIVEYNHQHTVIFSLNFSNMILLGIIDGLIISQRLRYNFIWIDMKERKIIIFV